MQRRHWGQAIATKANVKPARKSKRKVKLVQRKTWWIKVPNQTQQAWQLSIIIYRKCGRKNYSLICCGLNICLNFLYSLSYVWPLPMLLCVLVSQARWISDPWDYVSGLQWSMLGSVGSGNKTNSSVEVILRGMNVQFFFENGEILTRRARATDNHLLTTSILYDSYQQLNFDKPMNSLDKDACQ